MRIILHGSLDFVELLCRLCVGLGTLSSDRITLRMPPSFQCTLTSLSWLALLKKLVQENTHNVSVVRNVLSDGSSQVTFNEQVFQWVEFVLASYRRPTGL